MGADRTWFGSWGGAGTLLKAALPGGEGSTAPERGTASPSLPELAAVIAKTRRNDIGSAGVGGRLSAVAVRQKATEGLSTGTRRGCPPAKQVGLMLTGSTQRLRLRYNLLKWARFPSG